MHSITADFLRLLWGSSLPCGQVTLWRGQDKISAHMGSALSGVATKALAWAEGGYDAYYGVGLRIPELADSRCQGKKTQVIAWPGVWLDIDIAAPGTSAHKATNLPPDLAAVEELLAQILPPTAVVHTGYGLHVYHLFDQPLTCFPGDFKRFKNLITNWQARFRELCSTKGWHFDNTAKVSQVLRLPGTKNWKNPKDPQDVQLLLDEGLRYPVKDLENSSSRGRSPRQEPPAPSAGQVSDGLHPSDSRPPAGGGSGLSGPAWVVAVRGTLAKLANLENRALAAKVLAGESFAEPGERNVICNRVTGIFTFVAYNLRPEVSPEEIYEFFRPSIERMAREHFDEQNPPLTEELVLDQICRAIENVRDAKEAQKKQDASLARAIQRLAGTSGKKPDGTSSDGSASGDVGDGGAPPELSPDEIQKLLRLCIIQHRSAYYILRDEIYRSPVTKDELLVAAREDFANEPAIRWTYVDGNGAVKLKKLDQFLMDYATVSRKLVFDLTIERSYYDKETETFHEQAALRRNLKPQFDPSVQEWLQLLGGDNAEKLIDWISTITQHDSQTCAVYLAGAPGTGKTMLAHGLARLWTEGEPTSITSALGSFNADLLRCPLIVADEYMPPNITSGEIRKLVGESSTTITRKHLPNATLVGSPRLMLCANNNRLLSFPEDDLGMRDLDAVAGRFLYIDVSPAAAEFLIKIGGRPEGTAAWVNGDVIACHALWLRDHLRENFQPGHRRLVEGHEDTMHRNLLTQGHVSGLVIEWLAKYLCRPLQGVKTVICGDGQYLVNTLAVSEHWAQFINSHGVPTTTKIGKALHNLSEGSVEKRKLKFWNVRHDLVLSWAKEQNIGDLEEMEDRIMRDLPHLVSLP